MDSTKDVGMTIPKKTKQKKEEPTTAATVIDSSFSSSVLSTPIIEEPIIEVKRKPKKTTAKNVGGLTMHSTVSDLSIKVYEEQIVGGSDAFRDRVGLIDKSEYEVMAILHDRDLNADEIFEPSIKKPHWHILIRFVKRGENNQKMYRKVSTFLNVLGIVFREEDETVWRNRGVEKIRNITSAVMYLTHETESAMNDGKEVYARDEIVSNLTTDEIQQLREGYTKVVDQKRKINLDGQIALADEAYNAGYNLVAYRKWRDGIPYALRKTSAMKEIEKQFEFGRADRVEKEPMLTRLSVFIQGDANVGKTYAAIKYFADNEMEALAIGAGGGTGKFDTLDTKHDAVVVDDTTIGNVLEMADNRICRPYRRNSKNGIFCGQYLIITSNQSFDDWVKRCGIVDEVEVEAARSRFFICQVVEANGRKFLDVMQYSERGTLLEQMQRIDMFFDFKRYVDDSISSYRPADFRKDIDDYFNMRNDVYNDGFRQCALDEYFDDYIPDDLPDNTDGFNETI